DDVTIFVPYAAGGSTDALARATAEALGQEFDGNFVIENQPGAGGTRALSNLVDGPTDGTELAILASPTFLIPAAQGQVDYELEDLRPVGQLAEQPIVLLERGDESGDFLKEAGSERKTVGTNGPDTAAGIDVQRLTDEGDLNIEQIPFEGQAELITNLLGENLDAIVVNTTPDVLDGIENGEYNAIATFATDRIDYLPDTPTLAEEGYDMATNATSQFGLFAPAEIDDTAFDDLEAGLEEALQTDDV